jgi:thiosulfate dehydrogenase (quinone) large subunit
MCLKQEQVLALTRISLGLIFFWAFIDKVFGLGFATAADKSWLVGNSPTAGFLQFGTHGPFSAIFKEMAGSVLVDWLFMLGLLGIGLALILGIGMKVAAYSGATLMVFMWLALLPPEHHPFLDEHVLYALVLIGLMHLKAGHTWGFGKKWSKCSLVKKYPWMA